MVLIDEIDKADIDFPNDLLRELDERKFTIEELDEAELTPEVCTAGFQKTFEAAEPPIIVITSNDEKELPDAFLRHCLFYYIDFPSPEQLLKIVRVNAPKLADTFNERLAERAIARLIEFRKVTTPPDKSGGFLCCGLQRIR